MKLFLRSLIVGVLCFVFQDTFAQLSGNYTIPGAYPTLAAAITDLNTQGVSGAVTFTLTANETAPVGGYVINTFTGASATNTVTITASSGVVITAYTGTASGTTAATKLDAIFYLNGCDYVTLDGLSLQEDAASTTAAQWMEYGIAMVAPNATNGVQYCTIKNCTISLTRSYAAVSGFQTPITKNGNTAIYAAQHTMINSTEVIPTSADGAHSYNTFTNNTISNVFNGICLIGHNTATANLPTGNVIGGAAGAGNNLIDFGTTLTGTASAGSANGIRIRSQINCNISYNTLNTTANPHTGTGHLFGIFLNGGSALSTYTTNNNTISLGMNGSTTNAMFCVRSEQVATWTAENNVIENCSYNSATTGGFVGVNIFGNYTTLNINNNKLRNNTLYSASTTTATVNAFGAESGTGTTLNCNGNEVTNNTFEGTGTHYYFRASGTITTANLNNNKSMNNTFPRSGTRYQAFVTGGASCATQMNNNTIKNLTFTLGSSNYFLYPSSAGTCQIQNNLVDSITTNGTGLTYCIYGFPSGVTNVSGNMLSNINCNAVGTIYGAYMSTASYTMQNNTLKNVNGGGTVWGFYGVGGATMGTIANNTVQNIVNVSSATTHTVYGIYLSGTNFTVNNNTIRNLKNLCTTTGQTSGIYPVSATTANIYNNVVDSIFQPSGTTGRLSGYWAAGGTTMNVYNNTFSNIEGGTATGPTTDYCSIAGLLVTTTTGTHNFYNNTVRLSGALSASGASGFMMTGAATANLINNIFDVNVTTNDPAKVSSVMRKTAGTIGSSTNNNIYGIPDASNHFYYIEGGATLTNGYSPNATPISGVQDANFNSACSIYKIFMGGRESASFAEAIAFNGNIPTGTTRAESGAQSLASVTTDITGASRGATPDIGAYEFSGTAIPGDVSSPIISYTNIPNTVCNNSVPVSVTITDASGINVTAGSKPRIWYKKSTEVDALAATNTSADNGWKYVEATNSTSPFTFNIDLLQLNSLAATGDVIQYFVAAQDNAGNVALNTAGLFGGYCATAMSLPAAAFPTTTTPAIKTFTILTTPTALTAVSSVPSICISGAVTMSMTGGVATGAEYQWQSSDSSTGTFTDIAGANNATYTTTLTNATQHRNFQCVVKCGGTPLITSTVATVGYAGPEVVSTQGASRCGTGTVDLQATVSANATANWYAAATGGTPIGATTTFTTPSIATTTTYYVAASEGGATSTVGRPPVVGTTPCGNAATAGTDWPIRFNTTAPVTIAQVSVIPTAAGTFTVALRPTLSTTNLQTASFTFTTTQIGVPQVINLGFVIPTAGQYQLSNTVGGSYRIGTYSSTGACAYPFNSALGGLSIVGSATSSTSATNTTTYNMFYDFVVQEGCESARVPVVANVTQAPAITMPANITMCSNDPAQVLTVSSTNTGYTYEWGPAVGLNTTSGATVQALPSSTTKYTVTATDNSGGSFNGCAVNGDVTVTVNEIPTSSDTKSDRDTVCYAENVSLSLINTGNAIGLTYQWQNSANGTAYSNVVGATTPVLTALVDATTNNYYRCEISCKGNVVLTSTPKQIFVSAPSVVSTTPATRCGTGTVDLQATAGSPSQTLKWYATATSSTPLGTGTSFTTPAITATKDFYVSAAEGGTLASGGRLTNPTTGGVANFAPRGVIFNTTSATKITELGFLTTGIATTLTLRLYDAAGTTQIGADIPVAIPVNAGTATVPVLTTVPVTIDIPAAGTYRIFVSAFNPTGNSPLYYEFTSVTGYPYPIGSIGNITGSVTSLTGTASLTTYYYFYKITMNTSCESARQAVTATVNVAPTIAASPDATICSNGTGATLNVTSANANYTYDWGAGLTGSSVSVNPSLTTQYIVTASDAGTGCAQQDTVNVKVNQVPVSADVKATVDSICFSGNTLMSLINTSPTPSGVDYQWQSSTSSTGTYVDIAGATTATYNAMIDINTDKHYRCNISCVNSLGVPAPVVSSTSKEFFILQPSVASSTPGSRCGVGTVNLSATPSSANQTLSWFADATGGTALGTGNTFTTPIISSTTDYYVSAIEGSQPASGGRLTNPTAGGALGAGPRGVIFTTTSATKITELGFLTTGIATTLTVRLYNTGGTAQIGADIPVVIPANAGTATVPVLTTVPVAIDIPAAGTYRIFVTAFNPTGNSLYYEFSGVTGYPYAIGSVANITGSVTSLTGAASLTTYYYFYKMTFNTGCESPRVPVTATVNTATSITVSPDVTTCSAGPAQTLTATSANSNYVYTWSPSTGLSSTTGSSVSSLPPTTTTYSITADDASTGCVQTGSVKVTVNLTPVDPIIQATIDASPCKTVTKLEGTQSSLNTLNILGTGTGTSAANVNTPFSSNYEAVRINYLITVSELTALNYVSGPLTSLAFKVTTVGTSTTNPHGDLQKGYTIKIAHTNNTTLTDFGTPTGAFTTVYGPIDVPRPAIGWNTFTFANNFVWDGVSNILIDICHENDVNSACGICYNANSTVETTTTAYNSVYGKYIDNSTGCGVSNGTVVNNGIRPNMQIGQNVPANYEWSPTTGLFTDAAATIPYTGGPAVSVWAKPSSATTYQVSAVGANGCPTTMNDTENAPASARFVELTGLGTSQVTATSACDDNGWTNYYINGKIFFAINWAPTGTLSPQNAIAKNGSVVKAVLDAALAQAESAAGNKIHTMKRWWNVNTSFFNNPVNVRFYHDPAEVTQAMNAAGGSAPTFSWFKNNTGAFNPATMVTGNKNGIAGGATTTLTGANGVDQGVTYVQFDGVTSFSGGTGAAQTAEAGLRVSPKVFLSHVDPVTGLMDDYIKTLGNFPSSDPYSNATLSAGFTHVANPAVATTTPLVLAATGNNAIVDWVFVELRDGMSGTTTVTQTRAALLQKDGDVVDVDGVSPVSFFGLPQSKYLAIRHRNHIGFRTDNTVALSPTPVTLNFTNNSTAVYGSFPNTQVATGVYTMNGGDANFDGSIDAFDTITWEIENGLFDDYNNNSDYNLDGSVDAFDSITWELNNGMYQELD